MRDLYRETFDGIHASQALRQEVLNMTKREKAAVKRQVPRIGLIAAVIVLVLAGTALAASFTGLPEWFSRQWTKETGRTIEKNQMGVITGLTDEVGVSAESDGVTVTVDSVTRGEGVMWVLARLEGLPDEAELEARLAGQEAPALDSSLLPEGWEPSPLREFDFLECELTLTPELGDEFQGWSCLQQTRGENGTWSFLMQYTASASLGTTPLDVEAVTMKLGRLQWGGRIGVGTIPVAEGPWELDFTLPPIHAATRLTTGPCRVTGTLTQPNGWDIWEDGPFPTEEVELQDIQVTSTGLLIIWADGEQAKRIMPFHDITLVMKDGTELENTSGGRHEEPLPDGRTVTQRLWEVPVDLSQAEALVIGGETLKLKAAGPKTVQPVS